MQTKLHIIVACDRHGNIGVNNTIPWKLDGDLKRFKAVTMGHTLIVGRKTYESFKRALEGRTVILVTSIADANPDIIEKPTEGLYGDKIYLAPSLTEAIGCARRLGSYMDDEPETINIFVAGGARLYKEAWDIADYLDLTVVANRPNVVYDTAIPNFNVNNWELDHTPMKVEQDIHGRGFKSLSHIHYHAKRVSPGKKKVLDTGRDLAWIFNERIGHREMFDEIIRPGQIVESDVDNEIVSASEATRARAPGLRPPIGVPSAGYLAAILKEGFEESPEGERDYFNVWTSAPEIDKEFRVLSILNKACETVRAADKSFDLNMFIGKVVTELEVATGIKRQLRNGSTLAVAKETEGPIKFLPVLPAHLERFYKQLQAGNGQDDVSGIITTSRERLSDESISSFLELSEKAKAVSPYLVEPKAEHLELLKGKRVVFTGWEDREKQNEMSNLLQWIGSAVSFIEGPDSMLCGDHFPNYADVILYGNKASTAFIEYADKRGKSFMTEVFATGILKDYKKE